MAVYSVIYCPIYFEVIIYFTISLDEVQLVCLICLFDLILYVPFNNFSVILGQSSLVEPVLRKDKCVLLKGTIWVCAACNAPIQHKTVEVH